MKMARLYGGPGKIYDMPRTDQIGSTPGLPGDDHNREITQKEVRGSG